MAKQGGLGDRLLIDGFDVSGDIGAITNAHGGPNPGVVTDITQSGISRLGLERDGSIEFQSWFDDAAGQEHPVLSALPTGDRILSYLRGTNIGSAACSLVGKQIDYAMSRPNDGSVSLTSSAQANGYGIEWGDQLTAGLRTDTTGTNGASLDYGSTSTAFGGQVWLHVYSVTGTSVTLTLQDSADNSTFAAVTGGAFVAATTRGAQRIQLAATQTVRRYTRIVSSGTFTNAVFFVQFTRNLTSVSF